MPVPTIFLQIFTLFAGYLLITTGVYVVYLLIFRRERLPQIFSKLWFVIIIGLLAIALVVFGWLIIANR